MKEPIKSWADLINANISQAEIVDSLRNIYKNYKPYAASMTITGYCAYNCSHCIYPPNFNEYYRDMSADQWKSLLKDIYDDLGIKNFIHTGRSFNRKGLKILGYIKDFLSGAKLGIIDNGVDIIAFKNELAFLKPDWIDISLDGMEAEHDLQRNQKGLFKKAINAVLELTEKEIAPKINILTCLTNINKDSVIDLIKFLNEKGIKNFFLSPVSVLEGYRPSEDLKINSKDFNTLIEGLCTVSGSLEDAFIEIDLFDAEYMGFIKKSNGSLWQKFIYDYDHLAWKTSSGNNEFFINYYPLSLTGIREFIVNCNGDVILPKVMAKGNIPREDVAGSLLFKKPLEIIDNLPYSECFVFYINTFFEEKFFLKGGE